MRISEIDALNEEAWGCRGEDKSRSRDLAEVARAKSDAAGYEFGRACAIRTLAAYAYGIRAPGAIDLALAALDGLTRCERDAPGEAIDETRALATIQNVLAVIHCKWGHYDTTIEHLRAALELSLKTGDLGMQALVVTNMAIASTRLGDYEDAIRWSGAARGLHEEIGDQENAWHALTTHGRAMVRAGRAEEGLGPLIEADRALGPFQNQHSVEAALHLAEGYTALGRYEAAGEGLDRAEGLAGAGRFPMLAGTLEIARAELLLAQGLSAAAIAPLLRARDESRALDDVEALRHSLRLLARTSSSLARYEEAHGHLVDYHGLCRTVLTETSAARARALAAAHRIEWDRREADLVRRQNAELSAANARLQAEFLQKERLHEELTRQTMTDELTGVGNRRQVSAAGRIEFARSRRGHGPLSVVLLDVDRFKSVNDRFGHAAGDEVLRGVATRCAGEARQTDHFGRWGGEEFLLLLPGARGVHACAVAERMRARLRSDAFGDLLPAGSVTASFGVAEVESAHRDIEAAIAGADEALYRAKAGGRDRVALAASPSGLARAA